MLQDRFVSLKRKRVISSCLPSSFSELAPVLWRQMEKRGLWRLTDCETDLCVDPTVSNEAIAGIRWKGTAWKRPETNIQSVNLIKKKSNHFICHILSLQVFPIPLNCIWLGFFIMLYLIPISFLLFTVVCIRRPWLPQRFLPKINNWNLYIFFKNTTLMWKTGREVDFEL